MIGIYCIRNTINNKRYIGCSRNISKRFNRHKNLLMSNKHFNYKLQNDFNTYGIDSFEFLILLECENDKLELLEEKYINVFNSIDKGYNIRPNNYVITDEMKLKISESTKLAMQSDIVKSKLNKEIKEDTRIKISNSLKEYYKNNPQAKIKISDSKKGKKGRTFTEKEKELLRGSNNGNSKVLEKDVVAIRVRRKNGEQRKNVYEDYKNIISERNFKAIWLYQTWKHIKIE